MSMPGDVKGERDVPNIKWLAKDIGIIDGFLAATECNEYIRFSEEKRYEEAAVSTERGAVMIKDVRNNDRVLLDDPNLAGSLYLTLADVLPQRFDGDWRPVGLNERLRFY